MKVVVTGTLGFDYIMNFSGRFADRIMPDKIHALSLSFLVDHLSKQFGGTAGNIAYTLKLLGVEPTILAPAGGDFVPYKQFLESKKISTKHIAIHPEVSTSAYFVMTDKENNQIGSFFVGATKYAKELSLKGVTLRGKVTPSQKPFVIVTATDPSAMKKYVKECRSLDLPYLYDPAFQIATFAADELKEGIEGCQILIGNDYEIALIEEKLGISHEELVVMVPILIRTLGSKGSIIETRHDAMHIKPAKPKNTSDPTGAGDAYRAGFVAGYIKFGLKRGGLKGVTPDDLLVCGQMGSVAAVYTVEKYGTQTHTFTRVEFAKRYRENFGSLLSF
ncbi:MAG: Adenosine kinase [Candidatus Gottesmanbacteria bacterium GW2011_GWA2_47_9]|uniref:Adenosine kinase n=1 Tax=Candidatus Gottesmanbacteria bacterium GW2011_GWA2_47_9 TaxID=1618445 RepID=A0A0G1TYZ5_9BACT|nr:MAG: Adenosine kinase [Candidatus Gottesmanbacteria bacterium GW2011_GWA2_47_9]